MAMITDIRCSSCGTNLISEEGWVQFDCPSCAGQKVVRCKMCRKGKKAYSCKACGFKGP